MRCKTLFSFLLQIIASPHGGWFGGDVLPWNYFYFIHNFFFFEFHVDPPLCHWDPFSITVLLAVRYLIPPSVLRFMIIISLACGEIGDLEIV